MAGLAESIVKDIWKQRKISALYPPGVEVRLGDIYEYSDGIYRLASSLAARGVTVKSRKGPGLDSWDVQSQGTSRVIAKAKGKTPKGVVTKVLGKADAGAIVQLTSKTAYVMGLSDITVRQLTNLNDVAEHLRAWFWSNDWDSRYLVVTETWHAEKATFLTAGSSETQVEMRARADVKAKALSVADLSAGFTLADAGQSTDHFVGDTLTPLFRAHQYRPLRGTKPAGRTGGRFLTSYLTRDQKLRAAHMSVDQLESSDETPTLELAEFSPIGRQ